MATRTFPSAKSSLFAVTGSSELGGGEDDHLPVGGPWGGYTFRSAVTFDLDWSGVRRITSAVLWLRTSNQVHVGFSSAPDFYVARATEGWTANGGKSSADSGGGGGWSTSPDVYPGPSATTTGRVSKRAPTAQATNFSVDITAIVRAWAPTSVEGGGNAGKYGLLLYGVASGDVTEFQSFEAGGAPYIVLTYDTDAPPVATLTGPTGVVATTTPTVTGTATDPDGDPITAFGVEVYQGSTLIQAASPAGATLAWVTPPLPGGALTVRIRAQAAGVWGAWTAAGAFTVDRPPVVGAFSSPPASGSARRPPITFATSDPDGNATTAWDIAVYATSGGAVVGAPVYQVTGGTSGISAGQVTHTPTLDLPGGPLVVRARVQSGPGALWSAWSADHPFTIALTSPSIAWVAPSAVGAYVAPGATFTDLAKPFYEIDHAHVVSILPPAGQTITRVRIWVGYTVADPSAGGTLVYDQPGGIANGGSVGWGSYIGASGAVVFATAFEATASGGGVTKVWRWGKCVLAEWFGRIRLGDQVTALAAVVDQYGSGTFAGWTRAERLDGSAAGAWRPNPPPAAILPELPATEAWLGLRNRYAYLAPDVDILGGQGGFQDPSLTAWTKSGQVASFGDQSPDGSNRVMRITGDGVTHYPQAWMRVPVVPGGTYRLAGWLQCAGATAEVDVRVDAYSGATEVSIFALRLLKTGAATAWEYQAPAAWTAPPNIDNVLVLVYIAAGPSVPGQDVRVDGLTLVGPPSPQAGLDRWDLAWTALG